MKRSWISAAVFVALASGTAVAEDSSTPANEGICDELIGTTPGLYGLCVAYCEAQGGPVDLSNEEAILDLKTPHRNILKNYDKKMTDSDPKMPCVKYETACPLFTQEDIGLIGTQSWLNNWDYQGDPSHMQYLGTREHNSPSQDIMIWIQHDKRREIYQGYFYHRDSSPVINIDLRQEFTEAEYNECYQILGNHMGINP